MEPPFNADGHTKAGTAGGTLLVVLLQVSGGEVVKTIVLAAIGAAVSFVVSLALKWGLRRLRRGEPYLLSSVQAATGRGAKREKELRGEKRRRRKRGHEGGVRAEGADDSDNARPDGRTGIMNNE